MAYTSGNLNLKELKLGLPNVRRPVDVSAISVSGPGVFAVDSHKNDDVLSDVVLGLTGGLAFDDDFLMRYNIGYPPHPFCENTAYLATDDFFVTTEAMSSGHDEADENGLLSIVNGNMGERYRSFKMAPPQRPPEFSILTNQGLDVAL